MAGRKGKLVLYLILILGLTTQSDLVQADDDPCHIHPSHVGKWLSFDNGEEDTTTVSSTNWGEYICVEKYDYSTGHDTIEGRNSKMVMAKEEGGVYCFVCVTVLWRTPNVMQYHKSNCSTEFLDFNDTCGDSENITQPDELTTAFRQELTTNVGCKNTFNGVYGFTFESSDGFCNSPNNTLKSCEEKNGSPDIPYEVVAVTSGSCPDVPSPFKENHRYKCMGTWHSRIDGVDYKFAAIADVSEPDNKQKFKCLITKENQKTPGNTIRWGVSRFSECGSLKSLHDSPFSLVMHRAPPSKSAIHPEGELPSQTHGEWVSEDDARGTKVFSINRTHIHTHLKCHPGKPLPENAKDSDFYLSVKRSSGTQYLMAKYSPGKCDVELVCYNISVLDGEKLLVQQREPSYFGPLSGRPEDVFHIPADYSDDDMIKVACSDQSSESDNNTEPPQVEVLTPSYY